MLVAMTLPLLQEDIKGVTRPLTADDENKFVPIVGFDCRGMDPIDWRPEVGVGADRRQFELGAREAAGAWCTESMAAVVKHSPELIDRQTGAATDPLPKAWRGRGRGFAGLHRRADAIPGCLSSGSFRRGCGRCCVAHVDRRC